MYSASYPAAKAKRAVNPSNTPGHTTTFDGSFNISLRRLPPTSGEHALALLEAPFATPIELMFSGMAVSEDGPPALTSYLNLYRGTVEVFCWGCCIIRGSLYSTSVSGRVAADVD